MQQALTKTLFKLEINGHISVNCVYILIYIMILPLCKLSTNLSWFYNYHFLINYLPSAAEFSSLFFLGFK